MALYKDRVYKGGISSYSRGSNDTAKPIAKEFDSTTESSRYNTQTSKTSSIDKVTSPQEITNDKSNWIGSGWYNGNARPYQVYADNKGTGSIKYEGEYSSHPNYQATSGTLDGRNLDSIITDINKSFGIQNPTDTFRKSIKEQMTMYNRFKIPELNLHMSKCYGHVFFTRPSCNLLNSSRRILDEVKAEPEFLYAYNSCPELLQELTKYGISGQSNGNEFNMLLSNTTKGFALNDETLQTNTYGTTFSGYKISYGKDDVESRTASEFSTTFIDDKRIHTYRLHKLWVEYVAAVYRGRLVPNINDELNKILDYVCSVYYILTAEDGETILFWSKYFGVYPTTIPSSQYSWQHGETLSPDEIQVTYAYSYKQDFDPVDLMAFNYNAKMTSGSYKYTRTYDTDLLLSGPTWVGTPFVEFVDDGESEPCYKLRFTMP